MEKNLKEIEDAAVEINEVLKYAPIQYRVKIPQKYKDFFYLAASRSKSTWKYDTTKPLHEQNFSKMTKEFIYDMHKKFIK